MKHSFIKSIYNEVVSVNYKYIESLIGKESMFCLVKKNDNEFSVQLVVSGDENHSIIENLKKEEIDFLIEDLIKIRDA